MLVERSDWMNEKKKKNEHKNTKKNLVQEEEPASRKTIPTKIAIVNETK